MTAKSASGSFLSAAGNRIEWRRDEPPAGTPARAGLFWLSGFKSDMSGTKVQALSAHAMAEGRACVRFDYSGHGISGGALTDGTISLWLDEAAQAFESLTDGPQVVLGSSMGGWIALLLLRRLLQKGVDRVRGLVLLAPAVDMTERLMWRDFDPAQRRTIEETGRLELPSLYSPEPYVITRALIEDGTRHLMLDAPVAVPCAVRILQGDQDPDVPEAHARLLFDRLDGPDTVMTVVKGGDHRLSRSDDLRLLLETTEALSRRIDQAEARSNGSSA